ncbi:MAG TPA: AMP-binding protein [Mycobacteriales bacterium]|nr:AMP-binding protein [Mycobacteriales bacterium]
MTEVEETPVPYGVRLAQLATADPAGVAVVVIDRDGNPHSLTWADAEAGANRWGRAFEAEGVAVGDRVALAVPNSLDLVLATLGSWKVGAVPVPVRWDLPDWERGRVLEVIDPALTLDEARVGDLRVAAAALSAEAFDERVSPQLNGICSSGATGTPKVIMSARPALWLESATQPIYTHWTPVARPQTILVPGPMYHTNGFSSFGFLLGGDRLVILEKFSAQRALDAIENFRVTTLTATPTMFARMAAVDGIDERDLSSLVWVIQGAAMMPPTLLRRWFDLLSPEQFVMAYGMTEGLGLTVIRGDEWLTHEGSVGRGYRGTEVRILDEDRGEVATGEFGEIFLRWPSTGSYAYRGEASPLPTTSDGFASAGDIGYLDSDGYLYLVDRRADLIVSGGANVYPAEVEAALIDHPGIADVVALGLRDPQWGRRVHVVIEPADTSAPPTEAEVIAYAKGRLAPYKVPKTVEFVEVIPRSEATKVSRSAMVQARGG